MRRAALIALVLAGCQKAALPPPKPAPPLPPPIAEAPAPPPPRVEDAGAPEPTIPLRFLARLPMGADPRRVPASVSDDRGLVRLEVRARTLAEAREGRALLLIPLDPAPKGQTAAFAALLRTLGAEDRVAVGAFGARGFRVLYDFSADVRGAEAALAQAAKSKERVAVPLHRALGEACEVFARRTLPALRAIVLVTDGRDAELRRASRIARQAAELRRRASIYGVRIFAVALDDDPIAAERVVTLARATDGAATTAAPRPQAMASAFKALTSELDRFVAFDADVPAALAGRRTLALELAGKHVGGAVDVPAPSMDRTTLDLFLPLAPEPPPGHWAGRDLAAEAQAAEKQGHRLRAGVLWALESKRHPENRKAGVRAAELESKLRASPGGLGTALAAGKDAAVDVPIEPGGRLLDAAWRDVTGSASLVDAPVRDAPENAPRVHQVVLHRCEAPSAERCLPRLLAAGTAAHLFVDAGGKVTQLVDLARVVAEPDAPWGGALSIALAMPDDRALTSIDPDDPASWRQPRRFVSDAEQRAGFDLTAAQYRSLVPLLFGLTRLFPDIKPVLPIDLDRRETFHALLHPESFDGVLCHSNLTRKERRCPGPGLRLAYLNDVLPRWSLAAPSLDLEAWLDDLADPAKREGTAARMALVGEPAVPLLLEGAAESPVDEAAWAVRILGAIGDARAAPVLGALLSTPIAPERRELVLETLDALARLGTAAEAPAIARVLDWAAAQPPEDASLTDLRRHAAGALVAVGGDVAPLRPLLRDPDPSLRAVAAAGLLVRDKAGARSALEPLLADAEPWIRLLAARATGSVRTIVAARDGVGVPATCAALASHEPATEAISWFADADVAGKLALTDLFVGWRHSAAVKPLAQLLRGAQGMDRTLVLRALRAITGRDLGSDPAGWLAWRSEDKR